MRRYVGKAKDLIQGTPFGKVYPEREPNPDLLPSVDGRTAALRVLSLYISELTFFRPAEDGRPPIPFQIPLSRIHIEYPNNDVDIDLASIVFMQDQDERYESVGFTSNLEEPSRDKFGMGTVLQVQYDQIEEFGVEVWASSKPERRAIVAGLQVSMVPTEQMYGIRFKMPEYFDQMVTFTANSYRRPDEQTVRGRRIGTFRVLMQFNVVSLVNYQPLDIVTVVNPVAPDDSTIVLDVEVG